MGKKDCHEKKCKKRCVEFNYFFDQKDIIRYKPVVREPLVVPPNILPPVGVPISTSGFGLCSVFDSSVPDGDEVAFFEFNNKSVTRVLGPNQNTLIQSNITAVFPDKLSSMSFTFSFNTTGTTGQIPKGVYKSTSYSSNGLYLNKTGYITVTYQDPLVSTRVEVHLRICDNKNCHTK